MKYLFIVTTLRRRHFTVSPFQLLHLQQTNIAKSSLRNTSFKICWSCTKSPLVVHARIPGLSRLPPNSKDPVAWHEPLKFGMVAAPGLYRQANFSIIKVPNVKSLGVFC